MSQPSPNDAYHPVVLVAGRPYPPTVATDVVAGWWSCSPELLQRQAAAGELPVTPLRLGRRLRWPTAAVAGAAGLPVEVVQSIPEVGEGG